MECHRNTVFNSFRPDTYVSVLRLVKRGETNELDCLTYHSSTFHFGPGLTGEVTASTVAGQQDVSNSF